MKTLVALNTPIGDMRWMKRIRGKEGEINRNEGSSFKKCMAHLELILLYDGVEEVSAAVFGDAGARVTVKHTEEGPLLRRNTHYSETKANVSCVCRTFLLKPFEQENFVNITSG